MERAFISDIAGGLCLNANLKNDGKSKNMHRLNRKTMGRLGIRKCGKILKSLLICEEDPQLHTR